MSRAVLILFGLTIGSSIAAMARNFTFTLAGERFVARVRKLVSWKMSKEYCKLSSQHLYGIRSFKQYTDIIYLLVLLLNYHVCNFTFLVYNTKTN